MASKYVTVEHNSGTVLKVLKSDLRAAREAWQLQEHIVIEAPTYVIEVPADPDAEDPTNLILDGTDYIHLS